MARVHRLILFSLFAICLWRLYASLTVYISDSEFWGITLSQKFLSTGYESLSANYKPLFYSLLRPLYWLPISDQTHILMARFEFWMVGCAALWMFYLICRSLFPSRWVPITLTFLFATTCYAASQSFRVRSDVLSLTFSLATLYQILKLGDVAKENPQTHLLGWHYRFIFILSALTFFSTPKAVYFLMFNGVFAFIYLNSFSKLHRTFIVLTAILGTPFLTFSIASLYSQLRGTTSLIDSYALALLYQVKSFSASDNLSSQLINLMNFALFSPVQTITIIGGLLVPAVQIARCIRKPNKKPTTLTKACFAYSLLSLVILILNPQTQSYFIYSLTPGLLLSAGAFAFEHDFKVRMAPWITGLALCFLPQVYYSASLALNYPNQMQLEFIQEFSEYMSKNPDTLYYDGIGILPRHTKVFAFPSAEDPNNSFNEERIEELRPHLILYTNRLVHFEPQITRYLINHYDFYKNGIWITKPPTVLNKPPADKLGSVFLRQLFAFDPM